MNMKLQEFLIRMHNAVSPIVKEVVGDVPHLLEFETADDDTLVLCLNLAVLHDIDDDASAEVVPASSVPPLDGVWN
tara:strand:- start:1264 stop:1491 length:228 start_codon:yes stop_codon:yes gene_type:complete